MRKFIMRALTVALLASGVIAASSSTANAWHHRWGGGSWGSNGGSWGSWGGGWRHHHWGHHRRWGSWGGSVGYYGSWGGGSWGSNGGYVSYYGSNGSYGGSWGGNYSNAYYASATPSYSYSLDEYGDRVYAASPANSEPADNLINVSPQSDRVSAQASQSRGYRAAPAQEPVPAPTAAPRRTIPSSVERPAPRDELETPAPPQPPPAREAPAPRDARLSQPTTHLASAQMRHRPIEQAANGPVLISASSEAAPPPVAASSAGDPIGDLIAADATPRSSGVEF